MFLPSDKIPDTIKTRKGTSNRLATCYRVICEAKVLIQIKAVALPGASLFSQVMLIQYLSKERFDNRLTTDIQFSG